MRQLPSAPKRGVDLVRDITEKHRTVGRMKSEVEGRKLVWNSKPAGPRQPLSPVPVDPSRLDPWNPPSDLERTSRYVCSCDACGGEGKVVCSLCRGSARVGCEDCGGRGKRWGHAKNGARRLLNCQSCRGKGDLKCDYCSRGRVDCDTCATTKKLERWLTVDTWSRSTTKSHPPVDFGNEPIERDANLVASARGRLLSSTDVPEASSWIVDGWDRVQPDLVAGERVYAQVFELLHVPSLDLTYAVFGRTQTVTFDGLRLKAPPLSADKIFARRSTFLKFGLGAALLLVIIFGLWWSQRGSYFTTDRPSGYLAVSILALVIISGLGYRAAWNQTLARRRRAKFWIAPAILPAVLVVSSVALSAPSLERARAYLALHDLKDAEVELAALGSGTESESVRADVHLARVMAAPTCTDAVKEAEGIPPSLAQHARAVAHADDLALAAATDSIRADHPTDATAALACASSALRDAPRVRSLRGAIALTVADECRARRDWDCTFTQIKSARDLGSPNSDALARDVYKQIQTELDQTVASVRSERSTAKRLDLEKAGISLAAHVEQPTAATATVAFLTTAEKRDTVQLAREQDAERKRVEAEQRRQEQLAAQAEARRVAEEKREERRREAAAAQAFQGALMCNDGTESPSCTCGGSHRGCCSWHGGVAGCR